jgi:DNA-binding transcriptional MerR regulator
MNTEVPFTFKFLSDKTNVSKSTLREWYKREILKSVGVNEQNHPVFNKSSVERAKLVKRCRQAGYELSWIENKSDSLLKAELDKNQEADQ